MVDFILRAGIKFTPTDVSRRSIQDAITKSLADFEVKIKKASLSREAIQGISSSQEKASRQQIRQFDRRVRQELSRTQRGVSGASRQQIQEFDRLLQAEITRVQQLQSALRGIQIGLTPIRQLEGLTRAEERAAVQANQLRRSLSQISGPAAQSIRDAARQLTLLRTTLADVGARSGVASVQVRQLGQSAGISAAATAQQNAALEAQVNVLNILNAQRQRFGQQQKTLIATTGSVTKTTQRLNDVLRSNARSTTANLRSVNRQVGALRRLRGDVKNLTQEEERLRNINDQLGFSFLNTGFGAESFGQRIAIITARFAAYLVSIRAILAVQQAFRASLESIVEFDNILQDLRKVVSDTPEGLQRLSESLFQVARDTGRSIQDAADSFNIFIRQGLSTEEALQKTEAALQATAISTLNQDEATKLITASMRIFSNELSSTTELLDLISVTGDRAATTQTAIASFRELTALIASTIERSQEAAGKVGTAFKTIFSRIESNREAFIKNANALGANINSTDTLIEIIQKLNVAFRSLSRTQKTQLASTIAGRRQINIFVAAVESFNRTLELQEEQADASGATQAKLAVEQQKLSTQTQNLVTNLKELVNVLAGTDQGAEGVNTLRNSFSTIITTVSGAVEGVTGLIKGIREVEAFGLRLSSVFGGIAKLAFFAGGAALVRALAAGIGKALFNTRALSVETAKLSKTQGTINQQVNKQVESNKRVLSVERQRESGLRRILRLTGDIARRPVTNLRARAGEGPIAGQTIGGRAGFAAGLVAVTSVVSNAAAEAADKIERLGEETGDTSKQMTGAFLSVASRATDLGTTIGIVTGSLRAGLLAGLISAGAGIVRFFKGQEKAAKDRLDAENKAAGVKFRLDQILATQDQALILAFRKLADRSGVLAESFEAGAGSLSSLAQELGARDIDSSLKRIATVLARGSTEIDEAIARFQLARGRRREGRPFRQRIEEASIATQGGVLQGRFKELDKLIASAAVNAKELGANLGFDADAADVIVRSQQAFNAAQKDGLGDRAAILREFFLESEALKDLRTDLDFVTLAFVEQQDKVIQINAALAKTKNAQKRIGDEVEAQRKARTRTLPSGDPFVVGDPTGAEQDNVRRLNALNTARAKADTDRIKAEKVLDELTGRRTAAEAAVKKAADETFKTVEKINKESEKVILASRAIVAEQGPSIELAKERVAILQEELQFQNSILSANRDGQTAAERLGQIQLNASRSVQAAVRDQIRDQDIAVERLRQRAKRFEDIEPARAALLRGVADELEQRFDQLEPQLKAELEIKTQIQLGRQLDEELKRIRKVEVDARIREIQRVVDAEQDAADRRIDLLRRIGGSRAGREVFERELRNVSNQAADAFGDLGAAILQIQDRSVNRFVASTISEFKELETTGLSTAEALTEAQARRDAILERSREQIENRREAALARLESANDRLNQSEEALLNVRNQLPQANQRVIEAQRGVAGAVAEVESATSDLISAFQAVADAQVRVRFETELAGFQIRQSTGAFQSIGQQFKDLEQIFMSVTTEIRASEEARLQLARQIAQEQLTLLQQQFNSLQTIGVQAATATADELFKLQNAIASAVAITRGEDPAMFTSDVLQAVASLGDLFPGLQRALSEFGLEQLGLDPDILQGVEEELLELARNTAEANREQVVAANEQVRATQNALLEAEKQRSVSQDQLQVAIDQREGVLRNLAAAQQNVAVNRAGFNETVRTTARTIDRLNDQIFATGQVEEAVKDLERTIAQQLADLRTAQSNAQFGNIVSTFQQVGSQIADGFRNLAARGRNFLFGTPNQAHGSLTGPEIAGLISSASREKRQMPIGSNLMLANTSEVVLTRRQARATGLRPLRVQNAQGGNAAADTGQLEQTVSQLTNVMNAFLARLNEPGFVQQDINVQIDTERTINVRGVDAVDAAVRQIFEDRLGRVPAREEVDAVSDVVSQLILSLNEQGVVTSQGT
jgi:TP901 family phage tail tape measure protein